MISEKSFEIQFYTLDGAWLCFKLINAEAELTICPDGFMHDSLRDTVETIEGLCKGRLDDLIVQWYQVPWMYEFHFISQNDRVLLQVNEYPDVPKKIGIASNQKLVFEARDKREHLCLTFWRAFRKLQSQTTAEHFAAHWRFPFPHEQLESLTKLIKELKEQS